MSRRSLTMRPIRMIGVFAATVSAVMAALPQAAVAGDRHRHHHPGRGWGPPPRAYYAPPPRAYYAPPPRAYYAPPPRVYYAPPPRVYYAPPPPVYYAPPPAYYVPAPGVSLNFRF
jgi:hypothetical protein